jgi:beta-lactamase superfamily II metal-dependent hydrolase
LRIGIIDCADVPDAPHAVIEHLEKLESYKIEFIIFTHPHKDHYGGGARLFEYFIGKKIRVGGIYHTFYFHSQYIKLLSAEDGNGLVEFVQASKNVDRDRGGPVSAEFRLNLHGLDLELRCLSPSENELDSLVATLAAEKTDLFKTNRYAFNSLSTVVILESSTQYVLLTADAPLEVFKRLLDKEAGRLSGKRLHSCQIPHHGSMLNYDATFWRLLRRTPDCRATVSVGRNKYEHPSEEVLTSFHKMNYRVAFTNRINGAQDFFNKLTSEEKRRRLELDHVSRDFDVEAGDIEYYFEY